MENNNGFKGVTCFLFCCLMQLLAVEVNSIDNDADDRYYFGMFEKDVDPIKTQASFQGYIWG